MVPPPATVLRNAVAAALFSFGKAPEPRLTLPMLSMRESVPGRRHSTSASSCSASGRTPAVLHAVRAT